MMDKLSQVVQVASEVDSFPNPAQNLGKLLAQLPAVLGVAKAKRLLIAVRTSDTVTAEDVHKVHQAAAALQPKPAAAKTPGKTPGKGRAKPLLPLPSSPAIGRPNR